MSNKKKRWIEELPYIRGIAALGILIIHATGGFAVSSEYGSKAMYLGVFLNQFFRFGSPVFMMISGMVIFYNYRSREELDLKRFYKKKLRYIFIPYVLWNIVYYIHMYDLDFSSQGMKILGEDILLGTGFSHLYFIFLIFQFYLLVPLFLRFLPRQMEESPYKIIAISFLLQLVVILYGRYFKIAADTGIVEVFNRIYWKTVFGWQYYFILGGTIGVHYFKILDWIKENIRKINILFLVSTLLYVGEVFYDLFKNQGIENYGMFGSFRPSTMVYASITMLMLIGLTNKFIARKKVLRDIGIYSFGIYFSHPLILLKLREKLFEYPQFGFSRLSSLVVMLGLGILLTLGIVFFIGALPIRKLLMGNVPKFTFDRWREVE